MGLGHGRNNDLLCMKCYKKTKKAVWMEYLRKEYDNSGIVLMVYKYYKCKKCGYEEIEKEAY
jgi:predicted Zn-ribbon and HTH transcriptional regulator